MNNYIESVDNLKKIIAEYAEKNGMRTVPVNIRDMERYHGSQLRKGENRIPYIIHPLCMAAHVILLGIATEDLINICLLHDVLEDTDAKATELNVSEDSLEVIKLLTFSNDKRVSKDAAKADYYKAISDNSTAAIVKLFDRCNNISTMASAFNKEKIKEYILETRQYILPLIDCVEKEKRDVMRLVQYQIISVINSIEELVFQ